MGTELVAAAARIVRAAAVKAIVEVTGTRVVRA